MNIIKREKREREKKNKNDLKKQGSIDNDNFNNIFYNGFRL